MTAAAVPSPCTNVCTIDPTTGWCIGCFRTIDEIATWSSLGDGGRRAVWKRLPERRATCARRDVAAGPSAGDVAP